MSVNFANVTDITIPQGNVIKIHETNTGRVLWEKKSGLIINPSWQSTKTSLANPHRLPGNPIHIIARAYADTSGVTLFTTTDDYSVNTIETAGVDVFLNKTVIKGSSYANYGSMNNVRFIAVTKDSQPNIYNSQKSGLLLIYNGNANNYGFIEIPYRVTTTFAALDNSGFYPILYANTTPKLTSRVYITLAPDRNEFLITGLSNGLLILPANFNSSTALNYDIVNGNLTRPCRVPDLGLYFAANGSNSVSYSQDGRTWNTAKVFTKGSILGVEYISKQKKLCAVNAYQSQIALSTDGLTWEIKDAPFSNATAFDYSPDYDYFCVTDNKGAYVTQNFSKWFSAPLSNNFTDLLYTYAGVFAAHQDGASDIYFLFTDNILTIQNSWV